MGRLHDLHAHEGQSPWLDNLRRDWLRSGEIEDWVRRGVRGITSNPSIFQKSIESGDDYTEQLLAAVDGGASVETAYWDLVVTDIVDALDLLRPLYDSSDAADGYVSVEVDPRLSGDTGATVSAAEGLWERIDRPNLYLKVPATVAGLPAVRSLVGAGRNVNVTLIFGLDRYRAVMEAYVAGLEDAADAGATDLSRTSSVASFFISRVDTEVDRRLDGIGTPEALALRGTAAVAQAQLAFAAATEVFAGERWERLVRLGARPQRPLWASTSTKNPDYPDTLYVDRLIGPGTVNTLPEATLAAFDDHGTVARTVDASLDAAAERWAALGRLVDLDDVALVLEDEGVAAFEQSFVGLLEVLDHRVRSESELR